MKIDWAHIVMHLCGIFAKPKLFADNVQSMPAYFGHDHIICFKRGSRQFRKSGDNV